MIIERPRRFTFDTVFPFVLIAGCVFTLASFVAVVAGWP